MSRLFVYIAMFFIWLAGLFGNEVMFNEKITNNNEIS